MSNKRCIGPLLAAAVVFLAIGRGALVAQTPAPPAEKISHTLAFPEGDAAWMVSLQRTTKAGEPAAAPVRRQLVKVLVERKNGVRRDTVTWSDGATSEYWWLAKTNVVFFQSKPGGEVSKIRAGQLGMRQFDLGTFSWVGGATYTGQQTFNGRACQAYSTEVPLADEEKQTLLAWVDPKTMLPAGWSDGALTAMFTFNLPLPAGPLQMPQNIKEESVRHEAYLAPPAKLGRQRKLQ